ncbi:DNA-3-methyladenine glycosylase 2 family protein [Pelagibacteraceae bacterium]|nr:DNA-3-methyladenine glycosylase 2 family protein [Pelagibacteraceae bacterium]
MNKKINKPPIFWQKAKKALSAKDKKLSKIIESYPNDFLFSKSDPFFTLSRSIVGQQISVKAAQSVWDRLEIKVKKIDPKIIATTHSNTLKSVGLSRQKVKYLKNLANAFIKKKIKVNMWDKMNDEEIVQDLTQVKGIGRWTAEMFLIFNLCRADIFPLDDIGMIKGLCKLYKISYPTNRELIIKIGEKWKPYRSVATWYLWRSLDPIPVEY